MDAYMYRAALLCESCGEAERERLRIAGRAPEDEEDESSFDSDEFPKGPYGDGGGEADTPQHCDVCGVFLENPLTGEGAEYVEGALAEFLLEGRGAADVLQEWARHYGAAVYLP